MQLSGCSRRKSSTGGGSVRFEAPTALPVSVLIRTLCRACVFKMQYSSFAIVGLPPLARECVFVFSDFPLLLCMSAVAVCVYVLLS
jgi:hypothetical protein